MADAPEEETLPLALLEEKNQEIDHLSNEIQRLEQELEHTRDAKVGVGQSLFVVNYHNLPDLILTFYQIRSWRLSWRICVHRWNT